MKKQISQTLIFLLTLLYINTLSYSAVYISSYRFCKEIIEPDHERTTTITESSNILFQTIKSESNFCLSESLNDIFQKNNYEDLLKNRTLEHIFSHEINIYNEILNSSDYHDFIPVIIFPFHFFH